MLDIRKEVLFPDLPHEFIQKGDETFVGISVPFESVDVGIEGGRKGN